MKPVYGTSLRQALGEHRRVIGVALVVLLANAVFYGVFVYPLSQRVANVEQRNAEAERALATAREEFTQANGTLTGKDRASTELATFYEDVLPADLPGARRVTQLRLRQLARDSNLKFERDTYEPVAERGSPLTRLRISMVLSGSYADIRSFIYELETAPEFVVTDNVELAEGADGGSLVVTLELSTYFREGQ
jgi:Tfp pilus assembly protein PilO